MAKKTFISNILNENSKKIQKMIASSPDFKEFIAKYEEKNKRIKELQEKRKLSEEETIELQKLKKEKVYEKSYLLQQIESYKKDSQCWIQSNGPSAVKEV